MQGRWSIAAAGTKDLPAIFALLEEGDLPKEGLATHISTTLVAQKGTEIVGCAALELYQELALLRSVAVKRTFRKQGIGLTLTSAACDLAKEYKVTDMYLLTDTAGVFFSKQGFVEIPRSDAPEKIKRTIEFTTLCPETCTVMMKSLTQPTSKKV